MHFHKSWYFINVQLIQCLNVFESDQYGWSCKYFLWLFTEMSHFEWIWKTIVNRHVAPATKLQIICAGSSPLQLSFVLVFIKFEMALYLWITVRIVTYLAADKQMWTTWLVILLLMSSMNESEYDEMESTSASMHPHLRNIIWKFDLNLSVDLLSDHTGFSQFLIKALSSTIFSKK